jgi:hypothetical protein
MKKLFMKSILFVLVAALGVAAMPFVTASAAGEYDPTPPPQGQASNERLEYVWACQLITYERIGLGFEYNHTFIEKVQSLIDRAEANGKDASAVQAALDAFEAASQNAQPIYESAESIVTSHQGFDENGKVTDSEQARETLQAMRQKFEEIKTAMNGTRKSLHEAIKAFREANPRPQPTPTATSG